MDNTTIQTPPRALHKPNNEKHPRGTRDTLQLLTRPVSAPLGALLDLQPATDPSISRPGTRRSNDVA
jgi:hypothetical protein